MFTGCEDEEEPFGSPYDLMIVGRSEVVPETTHDYTLGNITNPESYNWTVSGPAEIVGASNGATVTVKFGEVGDVTISVSNGVDSGTKSVTVAETEASVTARLRGGSGVLRNGESDTVFFEFDAPVSEIGDFGFNTEDSTAFNRGAKPFVSGSLGDLVRIDARHYYAIYTAGTGNGTPEAKFENITSTAEYGSVNIDSAYVQLYRVDNIAPVADLTYSADYVKAGNTVTATVTFSEEVMPVNPNDTLMFATFSGVGISGRDTLMATNNPRVYTFDYTADEAGSGPVQIRLDGIVDFAGNELAGRNNANKLVVDNANPTVMGTAVDSGSGATITIVSTEPGTGMYLILEEGKAAPTTPKDFMDAKGILRSVQLSGANSATVTQALAEGNYTVYFMAMDRAGNYSDIESGALTMD